MTDFEREVRKTRAAFIVCVIVWTINIALQIARLL